LIIITFAYLGVLYSEECYKEDKIGDICSEFASKNNINKKKVMFKYEDKSVNQKLTLNEFLKENNIINFSDIKIDVINSQFYPAFVTIHKIKLIVILSIAAVGIATFVIVYTILNKKHDDYFIKATYLSTRSDEPVKLISDGFNINKIKKIKIDDKKIEPTKTYTSNETGEHTVFYSFNSFKKDSLLSKNGGNGIFNGIENLISVEFTDYKKKYPDARFFEMFKNCKNLKSVDLSKIELEYKAGESYDNGKDYSSEYFNSINYMFYNCSSLTSVNFPSSKIIPLDMSYLFAYCSSLKELTLDFRGNSSKSKSMSNAFRNCTSLVNISFMSDNEYEDLSYLFMGCSSLKSLTNSYFNFNNVKYMNNIFYDCRSLPLFGLIPKGLNEEESKNYVFERRNFIFNTTNLIDISNMFFGCSSLNYVNLNINTTKIRNYEGLFYNCNNLATIIIVYFTHNNLPDSNLTIFNDKIPLKTNIWMDIDFYNRIFMLIPSISTKIINLTKVYNYF